MRRFTREPLVFAALCLGGILVAFKTYRLQDYVTSTSETKMDARVVKETVLETGGKEGQITDSVTEVNTFTDGRENELMERVYRERINFALSQCHRQTRHNVSHVLKHDEHKLAYCKVPKVGCTFWLRTMHYLHNDTGGRAVKSPFEIPRSFVHNLTVVRRQTYENFSLIQGQIRDYNRFMFVRDPYSRLWSVYLDKFVLPDFWRYCAHKLVRRRNATSDKAKRCRHDVTFQEFLQFVTSTAPESMNAHWKPVSYLCDPCLFKPTVIGKVETFIDDAKYILRKIGYEEIMASFNSETYVEEELAMLSDYNFDLLNVSFYNVCLTERSIALLLWEVFQLNGYLPKEVDGVDALKKLAFIDRTSFNNFVLNYYRSASKEEKRKWRLQKAAALKHAFKSVPKSLTDKLVPIYKEDIQMFGYDSKPPGY